MSDIGHNNMANFGYWYQIESSHVFLQNIFGKNTGTLYFSFIFNQESPSEIQKYLQGIPGSRGKSYSTCFWKEKLLLKPNYFIIIENL